MDHRLSGQTSLRLAATFVRLNSTLNSNKEREKNSLGSCFIHMGKRERDSENILTRFPKTTTTTTIYFDQKKQVTKVNYLVVYIMIANLDMVYLEKPYGLIKASIPNI